MERTPLTFEISMSDQNAGLCCKDFMPDCTEKGGVLNKPTFESFQNLFNRANEWLQHNSTLEIRTCESVEFTANRDVINPSKMNYYDNNDYQTWYVRGLRLWMKPFAAGEERVQKIGYMNLVPEMKEMGGVLKDPVYETVDEVLSKFNSHSRAPGRIITIETQGMKMKDDDVDPDRSRWTKHGRRTDTKFMYIIRIFYEICESQHEEIGLTDFAPDIEKVGCLDSCSKYEEFSKLVAKASDWCAVQSNLRICNIQSVDMIYKDGVDTQKMNYTESGTSRTRFARVLRIAHVTRQADDNILPIRFSCKTFFPVVVKSLEVLAPRWRTIPEPTFETLEETMQKVSAWIHATGAEIVSIETTPVPIFFKGAIYSSERTLRTDPQRDFEHYMFVFRAYLKGSYNEPYEDTSQKVPLMSFRPYKALAILLVIILLVVFATTFDLGWIFGPSSMYEDDHYTDEDDQSTSTPTY